MEFLTSNLPYVYAIASALLTALLGYLRAVHVSKKRMIADQEKNYINRQNQLADEQQKFLAEQNLFRQEMREELNRVKEQLLIEQKRNSRLEDDLATWKKNYAELELENKKLQNRVHELEMILNEHKQ